MTFSNSVILLRSAIWFAYFVTVSVVMHIAALPTLILPRMAIVRTSQAWSRLVLWGLKVIAGLDYEVRGTIPNGGVLVAAKHMSMWDTVALFMLLDDPAVVVKRELLRLPFYGWYIGKAGVIGIDRAAGASALRRMTAEGRKAISQNRPIVIFPEGTRKKPGAPPDYKPGIAGLYSQLAVPCVPAALNSGKYWDGFVKRPGRIVLEFLEPIPAGLKRAEFMRTLESRIESRSSELLSEGPPAGFG